MRKLGVLVMALAAGGTFAFSGCALEETSVTSAGGTGAQEGGQPGAPAGASEGSRQAQYGEVLEIRKDGEVEATISVAAPQAVQSFFNGFATPTNGPAFATFVVTVNAVKAGFTINPFDFFVRTPEGARIEPTIGCEPALGHATLGAGEKLQGCLTVDVPHGALVYTSSLWEASSLAEWPAF